MKYTLLLPICDRPFLYELWTKKVESLNIPRSETQIIVCDSQEGSEFGQRIRDFVETLNFAETTFIQYDQDAKKIQDRERWYYYLKLGSYVADNYQHASPHIRGEYLLVLEDDVVPHPDVFNTLLKHLEEIPNAGMVGAVTYSKIHLDRAIAVKDSNYLVQLTDDLPEVLEVRAQAFGCFVTYSDLFTQFNFNRRILLGDESPDWGYCFDLKKTHRLNNYLITTEHSEHHFLEVEGSELSIHGKIEGNELKTPPELTTYKNYSYKLERTPGAPIFLVASTGRSGSTWIQRILSSHKDIMMWGEPQGVIEEIEHLFRRVKLISMTQRCSSSAKEFRAEGTKGWIPNLAPVSLQNAHTYLRRMYYAHFDPSVVGKSIWGLKVINWDPIQVMDAFQIFPAATYIFLHRDLDEVETSFNKRKGEWWPHREIEEWVKRDEKLRRFQEVLPPKMHRVHLNYNQFCNDSDALCDFLESKLSLEEGSLDRDAAKRVVASNVEKS